VTDADTALARAEEAWRDALGALCAHPRASALLRPVHPGGRAVDPHDLGSVLALVRARLRDAPEPEPGIGLRRRPGEGA
jgi:hypothetical protein